MSEAFWVPVAWGLWMILVIAVWMGVVGNE